MAERELKVRIVGDAKGAQNAFKDTEAGMARLGPAGTKANKQLAGVQGHLDGFGPLGKKASGGIDSVVSGLGSIPPAAALAGAGVAVAGAAIAKFALDGISKFAAYAGEVRNFQRTSGATAEESSRFVAVLDDMAISSETGAAAISKLTRNADAGKLKEFNIEIGRTATGGTDTTETLLNVADAYAATSDPAERARLRFAAFGKQGDALIPILEKGRAGLKAFFEGVSDAQILDQSELEKAERYRLSLDRLGDSVDDVQREIGLAAIGPVTNFTNSLALMVEKGSEFGSKAPGWFGSFVTSVIPGVSNLKMAADTVGLLGDKSESSSGKQRELAESMRQTTANAAEQAETINDLVNATIAGFNAAIGYERSLNTLEDAVADVAEKQKDVNDATRQFGTDSPQARAAAEELSRANLTLKDSILSVAGNAARQAEQQAKANGETAWSASQGVPAQIAALEELKKKYPGHIAEIDAYILALRRIPGVVNTTVTRSYGPGFRGQEGLSGPGSQPSNLPRRAKGGPTSARGAYLIGEEGPELLVMGESGGYVVPNGGIATGQTGGGRQPVVFAVEIDGRTIARLLIDDVHEALLRKQRNGGSLGLAT